MTTQPCCRTCFAIDQSQALDKGEYLAPWFIVCGICGNKRCPKATDHELDCTGSNEPGQEGSVYK